MNRNIPDNSFDASNPQKPFTEKNAFSGQFAHMPQVQFPEQQISAAQTQNVEQKPAEPKPVGQQPQNTEQNRPGIPFTEQVHNTNRPTDNYDYDNFSYHNPPVRNNGYQNPSGYGYPHQNPQGQPVDYYSQKPYPSRPQQSYNPNTYPVYVDQPDPTLIGPGMQKRKASGGLITIIIVLSSLLLFSFGGFLFYIAANQNDNNNNSNSNSDDKGYSFNTPDYTIPDSITDDDLSSSETHKESDYSDKVNTKYPGLKINKKPADADSGKNYNAVSAAQKVSESVVAVLCYEEEITDSGDYSAIGSGIILTEDGYVVTNSHVIGDSKTAYIIRIVTSDGTTYNAGVVGFDTRTDIAVLKMDDAKNLKPATFGDSDEVSAGEDIIVVGNPGGLDFQNSITKGVVSAVNRSVSQTSIVKYIQTDAPINPGNSGGPFVNYYGQVIGIATSKIVLEAYEGMGFAIPSVNVKVIVDSLIKNSYVKDRVKIGIVGKTVDTYQSNEYDIPVGIKISSITSGGPCDNTDIEVGDVITEADGKTVKTFTDIYNVLELHKPGDKMKIKYYSASNKKYCEITITLQEDVV